MASIADILNKYRARNQAVTAPPSKSLEVGGVGTVRRDIESERIARERQIAEQTGAAQLSVDSQMLDEQRKQTARERDEQVISLKRQSREERQRYQLQSTKLLDNLESSRKQLSTQDKLDQMETVASNLRLSNEKYRYELADTGRRLRLDNAVAFDTELKKSIFDDSLTQLRDDVKFQKALDLNEAEWTKFIGNIDIDSALFAANAQPSPLTAIFEGGGKVAQSVAANWGDIKDYFSGSNVTTPTTVGTAEGNQFSVTGSAGFNPSATNAGSGPRR